jgi:signal transduction histidine kinase
VLATGVLSISSLRKLNDNLYWTLHTKDVLQLSDELYASILESESNLRGYSLSRNSSFISEYSLSKQQSLRLLDSLIDVTTDNEVQQQNIAVIRAPIISRIELLDSILALVRIHPSGADTVIADKVVRGKQITQTIKNQLAIINKTEYDLLQPRNKGLYFNLDMLPAILLFTTLTGLGAGALLIYSLFQYHLQKKETDKRISEYQQQLTEQIQRLNASNLELEQFAYVASHDLQEPLRKISAFSDLLRDQYKDAIVGDGELYLKRITTSALRMRELITDLLSYSRASRKTQAQFIDLNSILDMVKEDLEMLIREKTATITYSKLPVVAGNTSEFRQLFQNLIANSLKFSKPEISG